MATVTSLNPDILSRDGYNCFLCQLPPYDLLLATLVCKLWNAYASDNVLWIPHAHTMHIAYKENESVLKRVVTSCKRYCHASEKMVNYHHPNIIVKALGCRVLVHSKVDAFHEKLRQTMPKNCQYLVEASANKLRMNSIMEQFVPWFVQEKEKWLSQNKKKQFLVATEDYRRQNELKTDLFNLCKPFNESEPTSEEITDIFYIFKSRGLQITLLSFAEFKKGICHNECALEECAELVKESDEETGEESHEWLSVLDGLTQELIMNVFEAWKNNGKLVFPAYWCVLLKKIEATTLHSFLINILGIVKKNISLNGSQLKNAQDVLTYYVSCVWSPSQVELHKPLTAAYFDNDVLFGQFTAVIESQEGIYSDTAPAESDPEDEL